jgi:hypothetical protein
MTTMVPYERTLARFPLLLCSNLNLLYTWGPGQASRDPQLHGKPRYKMQEYVSQLPVPHQVSTKSWPVLSMSSAGTAFKPSTIHLRVSAGSMTASISR